MVANQSWCCVYVYVGLLFMSESLDNVVKTFMQIKRERESWWCRSHLPCTVRRSTPSSSSPPLLLLLLSSSSSSSPPLPLLLLSSSLPPPPPPPLLSSSWRRHTDLFSCVWPLLGSTLEAVFGAHSDTRSLSAPRHPPAAAALSPRTHAENVSKKKK